MRRAIVVAFCVVAAVAACAPSERTAAPAAEPATVVAPARNDAGTASSGTDAPAAEPVPPSPAPAPLPESVGAPAEPMPPPGVDLTVVDDESGRVLGGVNVFFVRLSKDSPSEVREAFATEEDPLRLAQGHGRVLTTDDAGRVRIAEQEGHTLAAARCGELVGSMWLHAGMTSARLVLHRPASATVVVCDAAGRPCPGVAVLLVSDSRYGRSPVARSETDADGSARFADIAERVPGTEGDPIGVTVALALATPPYARIDRSAAPGNPLRLVLPPTGTLRVDLVDATGAAATGVAYVLLRDPRDGRRDYFVQDEGRFDDATARTDAGVATFPYVGLGRELEIEVPAGGAARATVKQRVRGPSRDGENIAVRVTVGSACPVVAGRLVDAVGAPIADLQLFADVVEPGHETMDMGECDMRCTSTTDADGRFGFVLDRKPGPSPSARIHIGRIHHGEKHSWGIRGIALVDLPRTLRAGETSIGDVVHRGTELLVEGVVADPDGKPIEGVAVCAMMNSTSRRVVRQCTETKIGSDRHEPDGQVDVAYTDAQGRFELRGDRSAGRIKTGDEVTQGRVELGAAKNGWFLAGETTFDAGATDVRMVMHPAGGIAGSILLPDCQLLIEGDPQRNGDIDSRSDDEGLRVWVRADGSFEVRNLRPGTARVVVRTGWNKSDEVLRLEDVVVKAGEITRDPRLQDFDPAASRSKLTVSVVDRDGRPVSGAHVHYRAAGGEELWKETITAVAGTAVTPPPWLPVELIVICPGYRHAAVASARSATTVVLDRALQTVVRVRLADDVPLPEPPFGLSASLAWIGERTGGDEERHRHPLDVGNSSSRFDRDRVVTLAAWEPGRYRVRLMLWSTLPGGGASGGDIATDPASVFVTVPDTGGTVDVSVRADAAALEVRTSRGR